MSTPGTTLQWIECEVPGCWIEVHVSEEAVAAKCWRCCMGQIEHLRKKEGDYLHSVAPAEIRRVRKRAGLSQKVLAFKLNISSSDVSQAERGTAAEPKKKLIDWVLARQKKKKAA